MALLAGKKSRTGKSSKLRQTSTSHDRWQSVLRDQNLLFTVLILAVSFFGLLGAINAPEPPFPYRLGDFAPHGLTSSTEFKRIDEFNTEQARSVRAEQIDPIFRNDPALLEPLPKMLQRDLARVLSAENLVLLPADTLTAFGLDPEDARFNADDPTIDPVREFADLKAAIGTDATAIKDGTLDRTINEFENVLKLLKRTGVIQAEAISRLNIRPDGLLVVVDRNGERIASVSQSEVLLPDMLQNTGRLWEAISGQPNLKLLAPFLKRWLLRRVPSTLRYDDVATRNARQEARESVEPVYDQYYPRDLLVLPGERINRSDLETLRAEYKQITSQLTITQQAIRVLTIGVMIIVLGIFNGYYIIHNERKLISQPSKMATYLIGFILTVLAARFLSFDPWRAEVIPLVAAVMVATIVYGQVFATITAFSLTTVIVLSTTASLSHFVLLMSVSAAAIVPLTEVSSRSKLIKVGFMCGIAYFVVSFGLGLLEYQNLEELKDDTDLLMRSLKGAAWCLVAGYLVAGSLPFVESLFGIVTDISLLEMSDISHPLLQELVRRAPGTYNHSIAVATIGETAADAIGANGLLLRVGAYFHDVGKMLKPQYFIENMTEGDRSRHEQLAPAMSTLIIIGHVKDGVDLAREHNLPQGLIDFIEQHHGTTLVEYFYREAAKQADQSPDHRTDAEEATFRYPGPKPQTREAGVMMLADAIESASRTLSEPTPKRIESLVHSITMKRLLDGQFDDCSLTLNELRIVEESLTKSLIGIYHGRIKYPDQKTA
ncbi:HD family phosphohydrolase [Calycomorphotria hydatis]|uniref:HD/PDEase domain-containing protein n=1 Tax=Calycomorphotria hydatis TaxID=2528027 RepID=A0A517TC82_9PLAN|nr:HDIG domain-containing metalloprotein [Calycomorphotria hydatis]QDT65976.1 hypothetical protein V22_32400 [Calycomorphotria hydatis]